MTPRATRTQPATELESCVLGIVGRLGPCTAYAVRQFLSASRSSYWSASAGTIYPLLERLAAAGWVSTEDRPFGTRRRRSYRLTRAGRRRLRRWLSAPIPEAAVAHTYDPIRTRIYFLDLVPPQGRHVFLEDAVQQTTAELAAHRQELVDTRGQLSEWEILGGEGAIAELEARLSWLRQVRSRVSP